MVRVTKLELHRTISEIMKKGDLDQLTTKKIRILCEQKYNVDLSSRKEEIDRIVMAFVNKHCENQDGKKRVETDSEGESDSGESEESSSSSESSGSESCSDSECSESSCSAEPKQVDNEKMPPPPAPLPKKVVNEKMPPPSAPFPKKHAAKKVTAQGYKKKTAPKPISKENPSAAKKAKASSVKAEVDDAALARQLQAEEFSLRANTVRQLFRNVPNRKGEKSQPPTRKKASAFKKKCLLSPALAEVLGTNEMSRPDVVQKMWSIVRERNLFDLSNKQYALCDEQLKAIFGKKRVRLIGMMKYLKKHIKDVH